MSSKHVSHEIKDDKSRLDRPPYLIKEDFEAKYKGHCFCGAIAFEVRGDPKANCFCHCRSCQRLHGAPASLTSIYDKENVQFTKGARDDMVFFSPQEKKTEYKLPLKISCKHCHSSVGNEGNKMMLILPALIDFNHGSNGRLPDPFRPSFHQYYGTRIRDIEDDLPKFDKEKNNEPLNERARKATEEKEQQKKKKKEQEAEEKSKDEDKQQQEKGKDDEQEETEDLKEQPSKRQRTA